MATQVYVVSGSLGHGERSQGNGNAYQDGEVFDSENASEAEIAQLVAQGVLVTPQRHAMMAAAYRIGGSSDVEAVLTRLRGLQGGHIQSAIRLTEEMMDPAGRAQREGNYNAAALLQKMRGERDSQLQAADKYAAQIAEIEVAGAMLPASPDGAA